MDRLRGSITRDNLEALRDRARKARYTEERTEWEMSRALLEAERASIEADPAGEFEELVGIYQAKGLSQHLARQVAEALTERDPVAA